MTHSSPKRWREKIEPYDYEIQERGYTTPCWIWRKCKTPLGYGRTTVRGREVYAHRAMYEQEVGPINEGLEIDHLCRVPSCINPQHLEPVTHTENMRRAKNVRVTTALRSEIRLLYAEGVGIREMGRRFGVPHTAILRALDRIGVRGHSRS